MTVAKWSKHTLKSHHDDIRIDMELDYKKATDYIHRAFIRATVFVAVFCLIPGSLIACTNPAINHLKQGDMCLEKGDFDLAILEYSRAGEQDPGIDVKSKIDQVYAKRIATMLEAGDYDRSIDEGLKLLATAPSDSLRIKLADAYIGRAWYYKDKRLNPYTLKDLMSAIETAPQYYRAHHELGQFYSNQWQYNLAIPELNRAITLKPDFAPAYNERAFSYFKNQKWEPALADICKAIEMEPAEAQFYYTRSLIYRGTQKNDLAIHDLETALRLSKDAALTEQLISDLKSMRALLSQ